MALSDLFNASPEVMEHEMRLSAMMGDIDRLDTYLSDGGVNPNAVKTSPRLVKSEITPAIVLAAGYGHTAAVIRLLDDERTDPNLPGFFGRTALYEAIFNNETAILRALVNDQRTDLSILLDRKNKASQKLIQDIALYKRKKAINVLGAHTQHGATLLHLIRNASLGLDDNEMADYCAAEAQSHDNRENRHHLPSPP